MEEASMEPKTSDQVGREVLAAIAEANARWGGSSSVNVYPRGFGRDVERGEVITTRDLEHYRPPNTVIPTRCTIVMMDEPGGVIGKIQAYADMLSERCDARGHDPISDSVIEQLRALGGDHRAVYAPAPNTKCPRCGGPAHTLLLTTTGEGVRGVSTAEELSARWGAPGRPAQPG